MKSVSAIKQDETAADAMIDLLGSLQQDWRNEAACRGSHPSLFFPTEKYARARITKAVCQSCPVRTECLEYALALGSNCIGVWGGTTEAERRKMLHIRSKLSFAKEA